jgi:hypothetical protein
VQQVVVVGSVVVPTGVVARVVSMVVEMAEVAWAAS